MKTTSQIIFLLPLALCLTFQPFLSIAHENNKTDLVAKICDQSEDKNLCYSTIGSKPDIQKASLNAIGVISLRVASDNAKEVWKSIQKRLRENILDPVVQQSLEDCSEQYLNAVEQLEDSIAATLSNAYADVRTWVEAAMAAAQQCQQRCGNEAVISAQNVEFAKLCKNILIVDKMLDAKN